MSAAIPLILFSATIAIWWTTIWHGHRLFHGFCDRFPAIAQREIPYAPDRWVAHPEKAIFFFRRRAADILSADPTLRRLRNRFVVFSVISLVFPLLWFIPMFIFVMWASNN